MYIDQTKHDFINFLFEVCLVFLSFLLSDIEVTYRKMINQYMYQKITYNGKNIFNEKYQEKTPIVKPQKTAFINSISRT